MGISTAREGAEIRGSLDDVPGRRCEDMMVGWVKTDMINF
jgi:hypothetical protein